MRMYKKLGYYDDLSGRWIRPGRKPAALAFEKSEIAEGLTAISGETARVRDNDRLSLHERRVEFDPTTQVLSIHYPTGVVECSIERIAYLNMLDIFGIDIIFES